MKPLLALVFALLWGPAIARTDEGRCACVRQGMAGALKPIEGADTVNHYRLAAGGAVVEQRSRQTVFTLGSVNPNAKLLGISPAGLSPR